MHLKIKTLSLIVVKIVNFDKPTDITNKVIQLTKNQMKVKDKDKGHLSWEAKRPSVFELRCIHVSLLKIQDG